MNPRFAFPSTDLFGTIRIVVGIILLIAALTKVYFLISDPFIDVKSGFATPVIVFATVYEASLGILCFSRVEDAPIWFLCLATFICFGVVSCYRWITGFESCGCLGGLTIHPKFSLTISATVTFSLLFCARTSPWKAFQKSLQLPTSPPHEAQGALMGIAVIGLGYWAICNSGLFVNESGLRANGRLGVLCEQETTYVPLHFVNTTDHETTIVGWKTSCNCVLDLSRFLNVPAGGQIELSIAVQPKKVGILHERLIIFVDHPTQHKVVVDLVGRVIKGV